MPLKGQVPPGLERKGWALHTVSHVSTDRVENSTLCPHLGVSRKHGQYRIPVITMGVESFLIFWKMLPSALWVPLSTIISFFDDQGKGYPLPSPGDLPNPGIKPGSLTLQAILYQLSHKGSPRVLEWVACNAGDPGSIPESGSSTGEGIGYPLQYSERLSLHFDNQLHYIF